MNLALNNLQRLTRHKTKPNQTKVKQCRFEPGWKKVGRISLCSKIERTDSETDSLGRAFLE